MSQWRAKPGPRPAVGVVELPAAGRDGPVPVLPGAKTLSKATLDWWAVMWASPMATMWDPEGDVPALARLAEVRNRAESGGWSRTLSAEARQLEDRFGMSPLARVRLGWRIVDLEDEGLSPAAVWQRRRAEWVENGRQSKPEPPKLKPVDGDARWERAIRDGE